MILIIVMDGVDQRYGRLDARLVARRLLVEEGGHRDYGVLPAPRAYVLF